MRDGITGLPLEVQEDAQIPLRFEIVRIDRRCSLQLRNGQVRTLLIQKFLGLLNVGCE